MIVGLLLIASPLAWWASARRQHRELERRIDLAVAALLDDGSLDVVNETIQHLTGRREWRSELRFLKGGVLLRNGDAPAAMREFLFVRREGKLRIPLFRLVGKALYLQGELVDAERALRTVVVEQPDDAEAHRWLAQVYHEFGSAQGSIAELDQVIRLRPGDFLAYQLKAATYVESLGDLEAAAEMYRQALERNPPEPHLSEIRRELARCLLIEKDYGGALEIARDMPEGLLKQVITAECYWGLGESESAQSLLDRLDETDADDDGVLLLGAVLAIDRGDARAAIPRLQKLLERNPQNVVARHQLSLAYQSLGDTAASKAESERMLEIRSLQMRREELHARALRQPSDAEVRDELAAVCEQLGRNDEAVRWRRNAEQTRKAVQALHPSPERRPAYETAP
ncbi:MAG: tetratricopeptide repeat protein [Planctomycetia bacterium]|nr:tetratricopeptide repeat protein [Planctomycetia bacterium]